jgi:hypothetical protein
MIEFPRLKTGAVAQYPSTQITSFKTHVCTFLDGSEQRYRQRGRVHRRWIISLSQLNEDELASMDEFFRSNQGETGHFSFHDPWDEVIYENCSLENGEVLGRFVDLGDCRVVLIVRQNWS